MRQMTLVTGAHIVVRRTHLVNAGDIPPVADKMTVGHHPSLQASRLITVWTHHTGSTDTITICPHSQLTLADDDRCSDGRRGYGCNRRCHLRARLSSPPRRESAQDWDRSHDYDRRRDDSGDRYRDC